MNSFASQSRSSGCVGLKPMWPKSLGRGDEAGAEDVMPDAVHHDAGGQRVARIGEPFGEGEAALLLGRIGREVEAAEFVFEDRERIGRDDFARVHVIAAMQAMGWLGLLEGARVGQRRLGDGGEFFLKGLDLRDEVGGGIRGGWDGFDLLVEAGAEAIRVAGDGFPGLRIVGDFDAVGRGEAVFIKLCPPCCDRGSRRRG
jgi:hypothetical protein